MFRRDRLGAEKLEQLGRLESREESDPSVAWDDQLDDRIGDDLLRLVFTACHPVLPVPSRVALTLKAVGGLTTPEIARAFLVPESTVAQRIVRAKRTLTERKVAIELPTGDELSQRLASVLEVVYLVFNEGYSATAGADWMRVDLCEQGLRLARLLAQLAAMEPEVQGLLGLLEIQASRTAARIDADGKPVLLDDQDRTRWDRELIDRGLAAVSRAEQLADRPGPYLVQAWIAACHARAATAADTDWHRIAELYGLLSDRVDSPVVELNRAVALARAHGPREGLAHLDTIADAPELRDYHLLPTVRGDLLAKLGEPAAARDAFETALGLTGNAAEQELLRRRIAELVD